MRHTFANCLYEEMLINENIYLLTGDLGYGVLDKILKDFPDRAFNVGAAEQLLVGMAVGMAQEGKVPICYSITPFLLYRPFEVIRNYLSHEDVPVKLVGSGRDKEYDVDGFSHWCDEDLDVLRLFPSINGWIPQNKQEIKRGFKGWIAENEYASFLSLSRFSGENKG